jgi:hypothetical protein
MFESAIDIAYRGLVTISFTFTVLIVTIKITQKILDFKTKKNTKGSFSSNPSLDLNSDAITDKKIHTIVQSAMDSHFQKHNP